MLRSSARNCWADSPTTGTQIWPLNGKERTNSSSHDRLPASCWVGTRRYSAPLGAHSRHHLGPPCQLDSRLQQCARSIRLRSRPRHAPRCCWIVVCGVYIRSRRQDQLEGGGSCLGGGAVAGRQAVSSVVGHGLPSAGAAGPCRGMGPCRPTFLASRRAAAPERAKSQPLHQARSTAPGSNCITRARSTRNDSHQGPAGAAAS